MNPKFYWYLSRASGIVAGVLLLLTLIWGLLLTTRLIERRGLPAWLTDLHRQLGGLTMVFIAIHMGSLMGDKFSKISVKELFIPFASSARAGYEAGPIAWGIAAFWGLLVVEGTSLVHRRMPRKWWRGLHYLSYPVALLVALHVLTGGTDVNNRVFQIASLVLMTMLTFLTFYRLLGGREKTKRTVVRPPTAGTPPTVR